MVKKLVLFDIDHTLLDIGDTHKKAFAHAFKEVLRVEIDHSRWSVHGYTDLQIIHELMDKHGYEKDPGKIAKIIEVMIDHFSQQDLAHSFLLEGAEELLNELKGKKDVVLGLVTGNIEEIGYTKLKHLGIDEYFVLGGFGDISVVRADLVDFALQKACEEFGNKQ
jgi:phosphoglycolate phosphatase-like HAD superfamily hydrolase